MSLAIQCILACILFTLIMLPPLYRSPIDSIMSYPPAIRKRVESLPMYQDTIAKTKQKHSAKKVMAAIILVFLLGWIAYLSGARTFASSFYHVFMLFLSVNLFDVFILDLGLFCHSKKAMIKGTEDMVAEYKNPWHHIRGGFIGLLLGTLVSLLAAGFVCLLG